VRWSLPVNVVQQQHPTARPYQQSAELCLDAMSMKAAARCPTLAVFRRRLEVPDGSVRDCSAARRPGRGMLGECRRRKPLRASVSCRGGFARGCAASQVCGAQRRTSRRVAIGCRRTTEAPPAQLSARVRTRCEKPHTFSNIASRNRERLHPRVSNCSACHPCN